jgi:hypothetical protein
MPDQPHQGLALPSELAYTLTGHEGPVLNVKFNVKGSYCVSCGKVRGNGHAAAACDGFIISSNCPLAAAAAAATS